MGTSRKNNLFIYSFNRHLFTAQCEQGPVFTNWFPGPNIKPSRNNSELEKTVNLLN